MHIWLHSCIALDLTNEDSLFFCFSKVVVVSFSDSQEMKVILDLHSDHKPSKSEINSEALILAHI